MVRACAEGEAETKRSFKPSENSKSEKNIVAARGAASRVFLWVMRVLKGHLREEWSKRELRRSFFAGGACNRALSKTQPLFSV